VPPAGKADSKMKEKNQIKNRINKKYTFTYTKQETFFALESNQRKTEKRNEKNLYSLSATDRPALRP